MTPCPTTPWLNPKRAWSPTYGKPNLNQFCLSYIPKKITVVLFFFVPYFGFFPSKQSDRGFLCLWSNLGLGFRRQRSKKRIKPILSSDLFLCNIFSHLMMILKCQWMQKKFSCNAVETVFSWKGRSPAAHTWVSCCADDGTRVGGKSDGRKYCFFLWKRLAWYSCIGKYTRRTRWWKKRFDIGHITTGQGKEILSILGEIWRKVILGSKDWGEAEMQRKTKTSTFEVAHHCTIFLDLDDEYRNPNGNTEII